MLWWLLLSCCAPRPLSPPKLEVTEPFVIHAGLVAASPLPTPCGIGSGGGGGGWWYGVYVCQTNDTGKIYSVLRTGKALRREELELGAKHGGMIPQMNCMIPQDEKCLSFGESDELCNPTRAFRLNAALGRDSLPLSLSLFPRVALRIRSPVSPGPDLLKMSFVRILPMHSFPECRSSTRMAPMRPLPTILTRMIHLWSA